MEKIGILTINDNDNYGNRLQNYAVQQVLRKFNYEVETINNQKGLIGKKVFIKKVKDAIKKFLNRKKDRRYISFMEFNKNIKFSKFYIDVDNIPKNLNEKYKFFFTGSDQVWNPKFGRLSNIDLLLFAKDKQKFSFSASFGINDIADNLRNECSQKLKSFQLISVREDRGKELVEEMTGRVDVEVLVDPTMLLTAEEWDKVSKKPEHLSEERYILNYFLGNLSEDRKNEINRIAQKYNCKVINILDKDSQIYHTGPSEFLYLEKNAFFICTDSFHSSVFAILYNKPFIVFNREDKEEKMNSRLDTLLSKFKLKERYCQDKITDDLLNIDYTEAYKILEEERMKANDFISRCLKD